MGTQVNVCASTWPPAGWTTTRTYCNSACRYAVTPSFDPDAWPIVGTG
ncbi:hypothetical protein ACFWXK_03175 [Streptomyces sp. NPDC059070]